MAENKVSIAVCTKIDDKHLLQIAGVDPRIIVKDVSSFLRVEMTHSSAAPSWYRTKKEEGMPLEEARQKMDEVLKDTEVIYSFQLPPGVLERAPNLRWIQNAGAGIEHLVSLGLPNERVKVTNVSGIAAVPIAEHVFCMMLMFCRGASRFMENKKLKKWERFQSTELNEKTLGIIGLGHIGSQVAAMGKAFGMKVLAVRKSAREHSKSVQGVDELLPAADIKYLLNNSDYVVLSVPLTAGTTNMIGDAQLKAMKPEAYLINISRGPVINEPVLIKALKERWIAGAGLDVFQTEPLPADSELWNLPNVILTPHIAGVSDRYNDRAVALFCDNLRRYLKKQKLVNLADADAGY